MTTTPPSQHNPYLEKSASLLAAAGVAGLVHGAQNVMNNRALSSKHVAKYLANSFSEGAHGVVDNSIKGTMIRNATSVISPDVNAAHISAHEAGGKLRDLLNLASKRQKVGIRMMTEGRFSDLIKHNLHTDPAVVGAHKLMSHHIPGIPNPAELKKGSKQVENLEALWRDKSHPLLSNIAKHISRGKKPVGSNYVPGAPSKSDSLVLNGLVTAIEPVSGSFGVAKSLAINDKVAANKYGKKALDFLHNQFIKNPIKHGAEATGEVKGLAHEAYKFGLNPISAHLKRTTAALKQAAE